MNSSKRTDKWREWFTYEEVRRLVGLNRTTLWKLVRSGSVKGARVDLSERINRTTLEATWRARVSRAAGSSTHIIYLSPIVRQRKPPDAAAAKTDERI